MKAGDQARDPLPSWTSWTTVRRSRCMLQFAGQPARPSLRLLVLHDDPEREFDYTAGAEQALDEAKTKGWTVVSINRDWATVF